MPFAIIRIGRTPAWRRTKAKENNPFANGWPY
jgi:hypothetical protein